VFVGVKMVVADWFKIPVLVSLAVIVLLVGGSIALSVVSNARSRRAPPAPNTDTYRK
jgi:predicted tellurium resistance membrane protein TerC